MYGLVYSNFMDYIRKEGFSSRGDSMGAVFLALLGVALLIVVQLFVVQWLWNTVLVRVLSVAKPLPSLLYTLGLLVLLAMLSPGVAV
jgi:hypothetical protein